MEWEWCDDVYSVRRGRTRAQAAAEEEGGEEKRRACTAEANSRLTACAPELAAAPVVIHAYVQRTKVGGLIIRACMRSTAVREVSRIFAYFLRITVRGSELGKDIQRSRVRSLRGG